MPFTREQKHRSIILAHSDIPEQPHINLPPRADVKQVSEHAPRARGRTRIVVLLVSAVAVAGIAGLSIGLRTPAEDVGERKIKDQPPVAVFGLEHKVPTTAARARTGPASSPPLVPERSSEQVPPELETTLRRCLRDVEAGCYAPVLVSFQRQRHIDRTKVLEQRRRLLQLYPRTYKFAITGLRLESLTSQRAVVSFDKEWDIAGERRYAGSARERLVAVKTSVGWQIVLQDEQQVYWTRRG